MTASVEKAGAFNALPKVLSPKWPSRSFKLGKFLLICLIEDERFGDRGADIDGRAPAARKARSLHRR